jgi:TPP-dependent 2-oxoacid decarboxylase
MIDGHKDATTVKEKLAKKKEQKKSELAEEIENMKLEIAKKKEEHKLELAMMEEEHAKEEMNLAKIILMNEYVKWMNERNIIITHNCGFCVRFQ